jgi:hypothetical protein
MMMKNGQESPAINWDTEIEYNDENGDVQAAIEKIGLYYTGDAQFLAEKKLLLKNLFTHITG